MEIIFSEYLLFSFAGRSGSLRAGHAYPYLGYSVRSQSDYGQQPLLQPQLQAVSFTHAQEGCKITKKKKKEPVCFLDLWFSFYITHKENYCECIFFYYLALSYLSSFRIITWLSGLRGSFVWTSSAVSHFHKEKRFWNWLWQQKRSSPTSWSFLLTDLAWTGARSCPSCRLAGQRVTPRRGWRRTWRCHITWGSISPKSSPEWIWRTWSDRWRMTTFQTFAITAGRRSSKVWLYSVIIRPLYFAATHISHDFFVCFAAEEGMLYRARYFGDTELYQRAQRARTPSCVKLSDITASLHWKQVFPKRIDTSNLLFWFSF